MFELYFDGDNSRKLGEFKTYEDAYSSMAEFIAEHENFKWYYTRITFIDKDNTIWFDVGSHTEFFYIVCDSKEKYKEVIAKLQVKK